ncbi:uncharacterized protein BDW70DRAFT_158384 [Aspergillus foveolatus]|uniref:uncharacterized protein n=1 Tax=Aspergillus foveolatus TaxID=210207 RepID=UPI003CCDAAC0
MNLDRASLPLWKGQSIHLDHVSAVPDVIPMQFSLAAKPGRVHAMIAVTRLVGEAEHASSGECVGANPLSGSLALAGGSSTSAAALVNDRLSADAPTLPVLGRSAVSEVVWVGNGSGRIYVSTMWERTGNGRLEVHCQDLFRMSSFGNRLPDPTTTGLGPWHG